MKGETKLSKREIEEQKAKQPFRNYLLKIHIK